MVQEAQNQQLALLQAERDLMDRDDLYNGADVIRQGIFRIMLRRYTGFPHQFFEHVLRRGNSALERLMRDSLWSSPEGLTVPGLNPKACMIVALAFNRSGSTYIHTGKMFLLGPRTVSTIVRGTLPLLAQYIPGLPAPGREDWLFPKGRTNVHSLVSTNGFKIHCHRKILPFGANSHVADFKDDHACVVGQYSRKPLPETMGLARP